MSVRSDFDQQFSKANLSEIYQNHVLLSNATGIDNLGQRKFWSILDDELSIIERKACAGTYNFTKFKLKLVSKGRGKIPREISIPTIRDRIALRALCNFLAMRFKGAVSFELPQHMVQKVKREVSSGAYNGFIKLDVSNFYPSIIHNELMLRIRKRIRDREIQNFIISALRTPTVMKSSPSDRPSTVGVPQGLSISNILAAIYLINIDRYLGAMPGIAYHRYVDDVLILCDHNKSDVIVNDVTRKFRSLGLTIHDLRDGGDKSSVGSVGEKFDYLGYEFEGGAIRPRLGSIEKLRESLVSIFTAYKHSSYGSVGFLEWRLNLRITGCVFQNRSKGWLFFFSEINDETVLHSLDLYVSHLAARFGVTLNVKTFVRSYYEIRHSKYTTKYVPNFDTYTLHQMREMLEKYFLKSTAGLANEEIEYEFRKRIDKQAKDLLTDVQDFS